VDNRIVVPETTPDIITLDYIEEVIQAAENPDVETIFGDLGFITSEHIQEANRAIQDILGPDHWLTASIDTTLVRVEQEGNAAHDEVVLDFIEEVIQATDNKDVETLYGDLGFIVSEHIQEANRTIQGIMGNNHWLTASIDTTLVRVEQ
jgi:hypothetical protein